MAQDASVQNISQILKNTGFSKKPRKENISRQEIEKLSTEVKRLVTVYGVSLENAKIIERELNEEMSVEERLELIDNAMKQLGFAKAEMDQSYERGVI